MRKFFRRPKKTVKRKPIRKTKKSNSLVTKSQLYRAINRNMETKIISTQYPLTLFNSGISAAGDLIAVLPPVDFGTTQNSRVGATIKPIRLVIRGYVSYNTSVAAGYLDAKMLGCRLMVFQDKTTKAYQNAITNFNLLDLGGFGTSFTGTALNYTTPHNNDQFKFYADRRMKIMKPFGYTNSASPDFATSMQNIDPSLYRPFTIILTRKHLPAVLSYDSTDSTNQAVNFAPYLACGYCDLTGAAPDVANTQLSITFTSTLYFKDA